jgi:hypothetical protein
MKKSFLIFVFVMFATGSLCAESGYEPGSSYNSDSWRIEPTIGPTLDIHNWGGSQFSIETKIGKGEHWSGLAGLEFGGANTVQIKLGAAYDSPFYVTFSEPNDFAIGPTVDAGMKFGAGRGASIDFFNIGFGLRTAYRIKGNFGVVADLVHFTTSFVTWRNGAGFNGNFAMAYDMKFGIYYLF